MNQTHETLRAALRLLDPRFNYIPADATNIVATWKRFGFDPRENQQRRDKIRGSFAGLTPAAAPSVGR